MLVVRTGVALCAVEFAGCASEGGRSAVNATAPVAKATAEPEPAAPFTLGGDVGLELRRWIVHGSIGEVAGALLGVAEPAAVDSATSRQLARAGFTLLQAPLGAMLTTRKRLANLKRVERVWIGQNPSWRSALHSAGPIVMASVDSRIVDLAKHRPQLLLRTWSAPSAKGPVMRVDFAVVDGDLGPETPFAGFLASMSHETTPATTPVAGAYVSLEIPSGWVYLLMPRVREPDAIAGESPSVVDAHVSGKQPAPTHWRLDGFGAAPVVKSDGPPAPPPPTLGAALLTRSAADDAAGQTMVIAFIGHVGAAWSVRH